MKRVDSIKRALDVLDKAYNLFNQTLFESKLSKAVLTAEAIKGAYGAFWIRQQYFNPLDEQTNRWKIALNPRYFSRPIEEVLCTLLHEMCHQYNAEVLKVQDCSRGGTYHNKHFKATAEATGLMTVTRVEPYGYCDTEPSEAMLDFCIAHDFSDFEVCERQEFAFTAGTSGGSRSVGDDGGEQAPRRPSSTRRYVCPTCGLIARTTRDAVLICGTCHIPLNLE